MEGKTYKEVSQMRIIYKLQALTHYRSCIYHGRFVSYMSLIGRCCTSLMVHLVALPRFADTGPLDIFTTFYPRPDRIENLAG